MDKISIIVPCYNEEQVLSMFYQENRQGSPRHRDCR